MSELITNARKYNTWQLLHQMTGKSKDYCKKVVTGVRGQNSEEAKKIMQKFEELEQQLIN